MPAPTLSFEVSPPRTDKGRAAFPETLRILAALNPAFITVTNGAGGSSKEGTLEAVQKVQALTGIPAAAHITYGTLTKHELWETTEALWEAGIRRLIVIHGDTPPGWQKPDPGLGFHYRTAEDFIYEVRRQHEDFDVTVAGDLSRPNVLENLRGKEGVGANRALTQFFFDNQRFHRFRKDAAHYLLLQTIPGLTVIANPEKTFANARQWGVHIPEGLEDRFKDGAGQYLKGEALRDVASTFLAEQMRDLADRGESHIHIFTSNNARIVLDACRKAGFLGASSAPGQTLPSVPSFPARRGGAVFSAPFF